MKGMSRVYFRAAFERSAKVKLRDALIVLEHCLPSQPHARTSDLQQVTSWPDCEVFSSLNSSVSTLAMFDREKAPESLWKAFELVNQRWRGYRLVSRLNRLVSRARTLLEEAGKSDLTLMRHEAESGGERASDAKAFLIDLRRIKKDKRAAAKIDWELHEQFLFQPPGNKRIELWCKLPAPSAVKCYARALEIIVDHQLRERLSNSAQPLLVWIAYLGNPAYSDVLRWDDLVKLLFDRKAREADQERRRRTREDVSERKRRSRAKLSLSERRDRRQIERP